MRNKTQQGVLLRKTIIDDDHEISSSKEVLAVLIVHVSILFTGI